MIFIRRFICEDRKDILISMVNEARTRKEKIDPLLEEAGWDISDKSQIYAEVDTKQSDFEKRDYKTFEDTFENNEEKAYADYLLLDSKGDPLAIIEAKRSSKDPITGQKQAEGYADDIKKQTGQDVFIFLTNGYEIWFWNREFEGVRPLKGFYTREDLENRRFQNISKKDFADVPINKEITDRDYQIEAIKRIQEGIDNGRRKFLIVQATGTGKTRVAMSLIDVLLRSNRVQRVLFLADRQELRDQAYNENMKLYFPNESKTTVFTDTVDANSRLYVSTIQTFENVYKNFSVGFFDLIISDEAHRSIYNKWKDVFTYFDAIKVGLTATPSEFIDHDTFRFFDCFDGNPTALYTYEQAVEDEILCDYKTHDARTHFQLEGITPEDVPEAEKQRLMEEYGLDEDDFNFSGSQIEKAVAVIGTNEAIIQEFWDYCIRDESGELPAKTIIFPVSIKHAKRIWEVFEKLYPQYKGKLARLITSEDSRAQKIIQDFKKNDFPRIAISVGMLDTGVNIPEICNLVFAKPIFSRIRFWQMIGRGTRSDETCEHKEWLPEGKKEEFLIFDFWDNINRFKLNPKGKESKVAKALATRVFLNKLQLYQEFEKKNQIEFIEKVKLELIDEVKSLPKDSVSIKERLRDVELAESEELWTNIGIDPISKLKKKIAPLMKHKPNVNQNEVMFTLKCEELVLAILQNNESQFETIKNIIVDYVNHLRTTINAVQEKAELIALVKTSDFWDNVTISDAYQLRDEITPLMAYKSSEPNPPIVIDMGDVIQERQTIQYGPDMKEEYVETYKAKVEKKIKELAENEPAIIKIKNNQILTLEDIEHLENTLNSPDLYITEDNLCKLYEQNRGTLVLFIKKILGMYEFPDPKDRIKDAFATFIVEKNYLSANQVNFIRTLTTVFASHKHVEFNDLFEYPFKNIGIASNIFKDEELKEMVQLCKKLEIEVFEKR